MRRQRERAQMREIEHNTNSHSTNISRKSHKKNVQKSYFRFCGECKCNSNGCAMKKHAKWKEMQKTEKKHEIFNIASCFGGILFASRLNNLFQACRWHEYSTANVKGCDVLALKMQRNSLSVATRYENVIEKIEFRFLCFVRKKKSIH